MTKNIAILGWGSLIWDERADFDVEHGKWRCDGPELDLEFSRISKSRSGALTLVIDSKNGVSVTVAWCMSRRENLSDAIEDLRKRENTSEQFIGVLSKTTDNRCRDEALLEAIRTWADKKNIANVIWTDLPSNFEDITKQSFSTYTGLEYIRTLNDNDQKAAREYIEKAPDFVQTPLREAFMKT